MRLFFPIVLMLMSVSASPAVASGAIGFIYSRAAYQSDGVAVRGNATLFDGSTIEIGETAAQVQLASGVRMWFAPGARATLSARAVRLLAGLGQFEAPPKYWLEARAVRVAASRPESKVRLALDDSDGAVVAPLSGAVEVTNMRGVRVGDLRPGNVVRFAGQAATPSAVSVSGCLSADGDHFALTDAVTNVPLRLTGPDLEKEVGHLVSVSGVEGPAFAEVLNVRVAAVRRLASGPCGAPQAVPRAGLLAMAKPAETVGQLQTARPRLNLVVVEGEGAINNIRQRTARETIVEVQDENHRPVAGALVLFSLPRNGASGTFLNGKTTLRVTTNAQGRATGELRPNKVPGRVRIAVSASFAGLVASIVISQTNTVAGAGKAGSSTSGGAAVTGAAESAAAESAAQTAGQTAGQASGQAGGSGAGVGMAVGAKIAIIGGVAATAAAGGMAAAGVFGGGAEPAVSR
jgi:hypothetical protein